MGDHPAEMRDSRCMAEVGVRLTREQLYDLVWAKPIRRLAEEFNVAAGTLTSACDAYDVPRPPVGYWTQLAHGHGGPRPSLPSAGGEVVGPVVLGGVPPSTSQPPEPRVTVRATLRSPHPAVGALRQTLAAQGPDRDGMMRLRGPRSGSTVRVSVSTRDRALRLLDALGRALVARGHQLRFENPRSYEPCKLEALVRGEAITFSITEHTNQREHVLTPTEAAFKDRSGISWARKFDLVPTGRLSLQIHENCGRFQREKWSDGKCHRLEDLLGRFVLAIEAASAALTGRRIEEEARRRAEEEARARRAQEERRAKHRAALGEDLLEMSSRWSKADAVRSFLDAIEATVPESARSAGFVAWLAWAKGFAKSLDPLTAPETIAKPLEPPAGAGRE